MPMEEAGVFTPLNTIISLAEKTIIIE
jgi:hypothetical protein